MYFLYCVWIAIKSNYLMFQSRIKIDYGKIEFNPNTINIISWKG